MFIDTNVLVQYLNVDAPEHPRARAVMQSAFVQPESLIISRQILREYLAVVTRPQSWADATPMADALDEVNNLIRMFRIVEDGPNVTAQLIDLCREIPVGGRQIHDANIVATMLAYGERRLLTFNTSDFRRYRGRIELVEE